MTQMGDSDPYIRKTLQLPNGQFIVHCQSREQSRLLMHSYELQADKTFSRTRCREFEVNSYDPITKKNSNFSSNFLQRRR